MFTSKYTQTYILKSQNTIEQLSNAVAIIVFLFNLKYCTNLFTIIDLNK